jgi:hypothetical protein
MAGHVVVRDVVNGLVLQNLQGRAHTGDTHRPGVDQETMPFVVRAPGRRTTSLLWRIPRLWPTSNDRLHDSNPDPEHEPRTGHPDV